MTIVIGMVSTTTSKILQRFPPIPINSNQFSTRQKLLEGMHWNF